MMAIMLFLGGMVQVSAQTELVTLGYVGNGTNSTVSWLTTFTGGTATFPSTSSSAFKCLSTVNIACLAMTSSVNTTISLTTDEIYNVQVEVVNNGTGDDAGKKVFYEYSTDGTFAGGGNIIELATGVLGNATTNCAGTKFTTATAGLGVKYIKITANNNCRIGRIIVYKKDGTLSTDSFSTDSLATVYSNGNQVTISSVKSPTTISVYSVSGALVKKVETSSDTSFNLAAGVYVAKVKSSEGEKSVKLLIQ